MRMRLVRAGRGRPWIAVAVGLYAIVLLGNPILHHDLACHLKTPGHCDACTACPQAPRIESGPGPDPAAHAEAGRVETAGTVAPDVAVCLPTSGRSPPA